MTSNQARTTLSRRAAIATALALLGAPLAALAQPVSRKVRIGFLSGVASGPDSLRGMVDPFLQGLRELGYVEGQNLAIEFRWAEGKPERLPGLLAELIRLEPDASS